MFYVYVLDDSRRFYIGLTSDLKRRLLEHKSGKVKSTRDRKNLKLIFYEAFINRKDAEQKRKIF